MTSTKAEKKVKDLIIPLTKYPHMPYWATLKEAVVQLTLAQQDVPAAERRRTVLVFDEAYRLQGILTIEDILRGIEPKFARKYHDGLVVFWEDLLGRQCQDQIKRPISEFLSPVGAAVGPEDSLLKASHLMLEQERVRFLLPVMEGGKVLGVVRLMDIFSEISRTILAG